MILNPVLFCFDGLTISFILIWSKRSINSIESILSIKNSKISYANTDHVVDTEILFDEIYNIDISGGHFDATAEIMLTWDGDITAFTKKFGSKTIHGEKMEKVLKTVWYPEFLIANSTASRTTFYRTLSVENGKFELFEKFGSRLTIDAEMPRYPFGNLDLYMEISAYSGNIDQMLFKPGKIKINTAIRKIADIIWSVLI